MCANTSSNRHPGIDDRDADDPEIPDVPRCDGHAAAPRDCHDLAVRRGEVTSAERWPAAMST